MKVNQNVSAVISNAHLHRTENSLTASIERLSSGYKLNKAKDNPAGMAISNKMRAQIEALKQSSKNAADGTSVMQTADGALSETHAMLQRMRELAVQAATDVLSTEDKQACQDEIETLQAEIDRIATDTEFNGKRILDGSLDCQIFPSVGNDLAGTYIRNFQTSDEVSPENYVFEITNLPKQAETSINVPSPATADITVKINGCAIKILDGESQTDICRKLEKEGELAGVKVVEDPPKSDIYKLTTFGYGKRAKIEYSVNDGPVKTAIGEDTEIALKTDKDQKIDKNGNPVFDANSNPIYYGEGFPGTETTLPGGTTVITTTATYLSDGKKVAIQDLNGFEMIFEVDPELDTGGVLNGVNPTTNASVTVDLEMTNIGSMTLQVGAHENQIVDVRIPAATCEALYIDDLNLVRKGGADRAITALDDAIAQVSAIRSRIGAYQNRLDYAVASLDGTVENMEAAISRVMDTDMAEEMSTYSNMNVLDQAAIAVLTQANDMPQQVLQLLQ